jgi:uncharacterized glyoxalase superfamily protein PhnB
MVVSVPVSDQDRARAFYVQTLGFEDKGEAPFGEGQRWIEVVPPGSQTSLSLVNWFPNMPPGSLQGIVLGVPDVEAAYRELAARGVVFNGPLADAPWGRFATFQDPDGNGWVLQGLPA